MNLALELVGFDEEVRAAIEHVFGTALVADSLDLAKVQTRPSNTLALPPQLSHHSPRLTCRHQALAFNKEIGRRTVTLDGDCFDPSGTLTGGSKQQIGAVLGKLQVPSPFSHCNSPSQLLTHPAWPLHHRSWAR